VDFECTKRGDAMVVAPKGSINTESSPKLEKKLIELQNAAERRLVVDFGQIDYISSAGLRVLLMTARRLKMSGGALALCSMNPGVTKVFALCGFERDFTIVGGRDEAIARVAASPATAAPDGAKAAPAIEPAPPARKPAAPAPAPAPAPVVPAPASRASAPPSASPAIVGEALRALSTGLASRPRAAASIDPEVVERVRRALTPT